MLSEAEILSKHSQALGEAHRACQRLGSQVDPEKAEPRGHHYGDLKRALLALEGSCRQMSFHREDTRWTKLGVFYAKVMRAIRPPFVGQRWAWFGKLAQLFEQGQQRMAELRDAKTGVAGAILPKRPSDWLIMPEIPQVFGPPGTMH